MKPTRAQYFFARGRPIQFFVLLSFVGVPLWFTCVVAGILAHVYEPLSNIWNLLRLVFFVIVALLLSFLFAVVAVSCLAGIFWPLWRPLYKARCLKNGAPFRVGDWVQILVGRHRGRVVRVCGAWKDDSVRVELGEKEREERKDIFSAIQLLREDVEPDGAPNSRPPSQLPTSPEIQTPDSQRTPSSGGYGGSLPIPSDVLSMKIRVIMESDRDWAAAVVAQHFGTPEIISRGVRHDTRSLPGLVAEAEGERLGLVHYRIVGARCEVVALVALRPRQGLGRRMLDELGSLARARACRCLWLVTTNDNRTAQLFFEALGWKLIAVHRGAIAAARRLKPDIPDHAADGTPIQDELEYERGLDAAETGVAPNAGSANSPFKKQETTRPP